VVDHLRLERHAQHYLPDNSRSLGLRASRSVYYALRPFLPIAVRKQLQRINLRGWDKQGFPRWPIDLTVDDLLRAVLQQQVMTSGRVPFIWFWPNGATACAVITHDVESQAGYDFCPELMDIDERFGFRSSFQIVPEKRYPVSPLLLKQMRDRSFEVNVHDFNHDGRLFQHHETFTERAVRIRSYAAEFGARGFRGAIMYRNPNWIASMGFDYDMSIPNTARLDPQHGGCCTVMPYFIGNTLELPLTTTQDYSLFHILRSHSIDLWRTQSEAILQNHGFISYLVHPDYILKSAERSTYLELLRYVSNLRNKSKVWVPKPLEVNDWWRARARMRLVPLGTTWKIDGPQCERARIAFASVQNGTLTFEFNS
jgi:hypothetical protein